MRLIERRSYLRQLESVRGVPDIRVLRGVRGSGKTELLSDLAHQISLSDPNANIIRAELRDSPELRDYGALHSFAEESFLEGKENCLLIDDADLCPSVELALASLHAMGKFDIYITCSGDFLSLSPLGTLLTGRTFDIPVFPFSFSEFLEQSGSPDRYAAFREYMFRGGMPGSCLCGSSEERQRCVRKEVLESVFRDIGANGRVRNKGLPERLTRHLLQNAGRPMTVKEIAAEPLSSSAMPAPFTGYASLTSAPCTGSFRKACIILSIPLSSMPSPESGSRIPFRFSEPSRPLS